jgi:hypothetical protein
LQLLQDLQEARDQLKDINAQHKKLQSQARQLSSKITEVHANVEVHTRPQARGEGEGSRFPCVEGPPRGAQKNQAGDPHGLMNDIHDMVTQLREMLAKRSHSEHDGSQSIANVVSEDDDGVSTRFFSLSPPRFWVAFPAAKPPFGSHILPLLFGRRPQTKTAKTTPPGSAMLASFRARSVSLAIWIASVGPRLAASPRQQKGSCRSEAPPDQSELPAPCCPCCGAPDGYDSNRLITYWCSTKQPKQRWAYVNDMIQTEQNRCLDATGVSPRQALSPAPRVFLGRCGHGRPLLLTPSTSGRSLLQG